MAKNDDFDGKVSIFWLKYNLFMLLLHTRGLVCKGIFILPFGLILNMVPCNPKDWNRLCMKRNMQKSPNVCYAEAANSGTMYSICIIGREQFPLLQKCIFLTTFSTIWQEWSATRELPHRKFVFFLFFSFLQPRITKLPGHQTKNYKILTEQTYLRFIPLGKSMGSRNPPKNIFA